MKQSNVDLTSLRLTANDAEKHGWMVCLSPRTVKALLDKVEAMEKAPIAENIKHE